MSDQEKKQKTSISPQPDADNKKQASELSEEGLEKVSGGFLKIDGITGESKDNPSRDKIDISSF